MDYIIPGSPVACPRPKVSKFGTYYPASYKAWREKARKILEAMEPVDSLEIIFVFPRPKSFAEGTRIPHMVKPDIDNLVKSVLDSLPFDDKIICRIVAEKWRGASQEEPHTIVRIEKFDTIPF